MGKRRKSDAEHWERWAAEVLRGTHLREPPPGTLRRAEALAAALPRRTGPRTWVARRFDSALEPAPAGLRSAPAAERRVLFEIRTSPQGSVVHHVDIRLRRRGAEREIELVGEVLPALPGTRIVVGAGRTRRVSAVGAEGEFALERLPARARALRLTLRHGRRAIPLGTLELTE